MPSKGVLLICCGPGEMTCSGTGMVSMLPTVNPDLFKVEGGNVQVPQKLLEHAHPDLHRANVTRILKLPDGTFQIEAMQHMTSHVSFMCMCLIKLAAKPDAASSEVSHSSSAPMHGLLAVQP